MRTSLAHLDYEIVIHKDKLRLAEAWCNEHLELRWNPLDNRNGRWAMFWAGRDEFDKYRVCFATKKI